MFPIFYWQCHCSASIDQKMVRLSLFLKNNISFITLPCLVVILFILPLSHCSDTKLTIAYVNINTILVISILSNLIAISQSILYYDNFNELWTELRALNYLIYKRLQHKINFQEFLYTFRLSVSLMPFILLPHIIFKYICVDSFLNKFQTPLVILKLMQTYMKFHVIFMIGLFQFIYKMFVKYINFAHHLNQSNLVFSDINNTFKHLKFFKEIHYKLWIISRELNKVFGFSIASFFGQTFFVTTHSIYFVFHYWKNNSDIELISTYYFTLFV